MDEFATILTEEGKIIIRLDWENTPGHAENFKKLVEEKFYDGMFFHRIVPNFLIQIGDPNTKPGVVPPSAAIQFRTKSFPAKRHVRGVLNAARQDDQFNPEKRSSGSQFCIFVGEGKHLDGNYTVFGEVVEGLEIADKIVNKPRNERDFPIESVRVKIIMGKR